VAHLTGRDGVGDARPRWLQQWLTLGDEFSGVVYDTASISTMHALAAAREEASTAIRERGLSGRGDVPSSHLHL
jgi:aromatic-L-amino-acid decarboxylase